MTLFVPPLIVPQTLYMYLKDAPIKKIPEPLFLFKINNYKIMKKNNEIICSQNEIFFFIMKKLNHISALYFDLLFFVFFLIFLNKLKIDSKEKKKNSYDISVIENP